MMKQRRSRQRRIRTAEYQLMVHGLVGVGCVWFLAASSTAARPALAGAQEAAQ
jgi:hypothetical protein